MQSYLNIDGPAQRTIVVGDIHGCMDELLELLDQIEFNADDLLVTVGDMVDRGPDSWEVARYFRDTPNAYSCLGNHERRVAGTVRGTSQPAWTQKQTLSRLDGDEWTAWADWLAELPLVIETPHAIVAHARIDPTCPLNQQDERHTCAVGGPTVIIENDAEGVPLWYGAPRWPKPVCIGHLRYSRVELVPGRFYALDTGVAKGGTLSAVILPEGRVVSVPARANHYEAALKEWQFTMQWQAASDLARHKIEVRPTAENLTLYEATHLLRRRPGADDQSGPQPHEVRSYVEKLDLDGVSEILCDLLGDRFGDCPEGQAARRALSSQVIGQFSTQRLGQVAWQLFCGKKLGLEHLAQLAPLTTVVDSHQVLAELLAEVQRVCSQP